MKQLSYCLLKRQKKPILHSHIRFDINLFYNAGVVNETSGLASCF